MEGQLLRLLLLTAPFLLAVQAENAIIASQNVTNWGYWGDWDLCPEGSYAAGFQLKSESYQGAGDFDDTALNAIKLYCNTFLGGETVKEVTSYVGKNGAWGSTFPCGKGYINGFQLRSQESQGGLATQDDTAANNLRVFCSDDDTYIEGDGLPWGNWQSEIRCPAGTFVCGLRTQIEEFRFAPGVLSGDDTGLNNVQFQCCSDPPATCVPASRWEVVTSCDSRAGPKGCPFQAYVGTKSSSIGAIVVSQKEAAKLQVNFAAHPTLGGINWGQESPRVFGSAGASVPLQYVSPGNQTSSLNQLIGYCGDYQVHSSKIRITLFGNDGRFTIQSPTTLPLPMKK